MRAATIIAASALSLPTLLIKKLRTTLRTKY